MDRGPVRASHLLVKHRCAPTSNVFLGLRLSTMDFKIVPDQKKNFHACAVCYLQAQRVGYSTKELRLLTALNVDDTVALSGCMLLCSAICENCFLGGAGTSGGRRPGRSRRSRAARRRRWTRSWASGSSWLLAAPTSRRWRRPNRTAAARAAAATSASSAPGRCRSPSRTPRTPSRCPLSLPHPPAWYPRFNSLPAPAFMHSDVRGGCLASATTMRSSWGANMEFSFLARAVVEVQIQQPDILGGGCCLSTGAHRWNQL